MRRLATSLMALALGATFSVSTAIAEEVTAEADTQERGTGLLPLSDEEYAALDERDPLMRGALPQFVDLSSYFPKPGHQGSQGSCVGWAVGYALKTYQEAMETQTAQPEAYNHFSPSFIFNSIKRGDDCKAGSYIVDALDFVSTTGAVPMSEFPYIEDQCPAPPEELLSRAKGYSIKTYEKLDRGSLFAIREALSNDKPVVAGMFVYPSFLNWQGDGIYKHDPENEFEEDYHAVTIVGFDNERKALRLINSWGEDWGDNGYFWMDYNASRELIREAYVTTDRRFDDPTTEEPGIVFASNPVEGTGSVAAAGAPDTEPESNAPVTLEMPPFEPLTAEILSAAVTGHVGRSAEGQTPQGYDYYPASVWLNLDDSQFNQIADAEYYFNHPTFYNPKRPVEDTNVYLATWKGYGCIEDASVKVTLTSGEVINAPFNLCTIWDRFHPGGFRKDGTRSGSQPLSNDEAFDDEGSAPRKSSFRKKDG